ncbi:MAG: FtsX-like permease family protein [Planctomycetes bacterium]|nr:FtsX-like permease family protein [Planctomycetota bacterium]
MRALVGPLALRRVRLEPGRTALLVLGVALGVAVFVAVRALNRTAVATLGKLDQVAAGGAALVVDGGAGGVPLDLLPALRAVDGVRAAAPVVARFAREATTDQAGPDAADAPRVLVLGLDLLDPAARDVAASRDVGVVFDPAALLLPRPALVAAPFARRRGLGLRSTFELFAREGRAPFVVAGVFEPRGPAAEVTGGDLVVLPLGLALEAFGPTDRCDRVAVALDDGADAEEVAARLRTVVGTRPDGAGLRVEAPGAGALQAGALLGTMQLGLTIASLLALVVGQFLIYNAMSIAVVRRRPELGVLRAVGASRAHLALLLLAEATAFGVVGAALGLGLGALLADAALGLVNAQVTQLYAMLDARQVALEPSTVALGLLAGPVATVLASVPPVVSALAVSPVEAARKDPPRARADRAVRAIGAVGAAALLGSGAWYLASAGQSIAEGALLLVGVAGGAALLAPLAASRAVTLLRPLLARLGPTGALAADALLVRPGRAGVTVAALMVALGGVLAISGLVRSLERAVTTWVGQVLVADIYCSASNPLGSQGNTLLDADQVQADLLAVPGVAQAYPIRFVFEEAATRSRAGLLRRGQTLLMAFDLAFLGDHSRIPVTASVEGGLQGAIARIVERPGDRVAISSNLARARGVGVGDRITLRTPEGPWSPEVVLCVVDYSSEHGSVYVDLPEYRRRWQDARANAFDCFVAPGADPGAVAAEVRRRLGGRYDLFVTENAAFRRQVLVVVEGAFTVTYAMQVIAIGVALLGVVTTLLATALERTRELGVLRAVGATRGQVRRTVITEAALLGALAGLFAAGLGAAMGLALVTRVIAGQYGWDLEYVYPWGQALWGGALATALAAAAGALPAERAARVEVVRALEGA